MGTRLATTRGQGRAAVPAPHFQVLNLHQHHEPPQGPGFPCRTNRRPQGSRPPTWDPRDLGLHPGSVRGPRVKGTQPRHQHLLHSLRGPLGAGHQSGGGLGGGPPANQGVGVGVDLPSWEEALGTNIPTMKHVPKSARAE